MKALRYIKEWFLLTVAAFLLYIILWLPVIQEEFNWDPFALLIEFTYCGIFILTSMGVEYLILRRKNIHKLTPSRLAFDGILTLGLNLTLGFLYEILSSRLLWPAPSEDGFWCSVYIFCTIASIVSQIHIGRYYTKLIYNQQNENLALAKTKLKSQLNPHFIFNSLNILTGLIKEDPDRAEQFVVSLSKIYRYTINSIEKDIVPISEAIIFTKEYVSIMQTRFPSSIDFDDSNLEYDSDEKILTMSMQLLIENAIKHNSPSLEHALQIIIFKRGDFLVVSNNLLDTEQKPIYDASGSSLGLKNLRQRYLMECGEEPMINISEKAGKRFFEVSLPIIH